MRLVAFLVLCCAAFAAAPAAHAATTVFAAGVVGTTGPVTAPNAAIGAADGSSALMQRGGSFSLIDLQMSAAASGSNTIINGVRGTANTFVQVAIGEVVGGVTTFSVFTNLPGGFGPTYALDLSTLCSGISASGCSLLRIRVAGPPGGSFLLDGVSGVAAAPEPGTWALMMLAFGATAWRLKAAKMRLRPVYLG